MMIEARFRPGTELPPLSLPPVSRATLALFAGASADYNPVHIDIDAARAANFDDVFAHGMLTMAYLARYLASLFDQQEIVSFSARFIAPVQIGDRLRCECRVIEASDSIRLALRIVDQAEREKLTGDAVVTASSVAQNG